MAPITLDLLIARNKSWAMHSLRSDPSYFRRHLKNQAPQCLWISCADSRVPAESLVQASPGELFVLRNVANQVLVHDDGMMSGVHYALVSLKIKMVVICGHTGCGGVALAGEQAISAQKHELTTEGPLERQLAPLSQFYRQQLKSYPEWLDQSHLNLQRRLVEVNVRQQVAQLRRTTLFQTMNDEHPIMLYGCVYDLEQGRLHTLSDDDRGENI